MNNSMIDSLAGYKLLIGGDCVIRRLRALCRYLVNTRVTVGLLNEVETITCDFEKGLREFNITPHGIKVGEKLKGLRGIILRGEPEPELATFAEGGSE
ncbi:hypothetical protein LG325_00305 [Marinobacter nauticus]